jgi:hypothetical protein
MKRLLLLVIATAAACGSNEELPAGPDVVVAPDPLEVSATPPPGSLDDIHARVIEKRCSGQPGLCHNGQFEPNLSTPALMYAYLVNRPGLEKPALLRVNPGNSAQSLFIDKIRNRNGVATQMPLGAPPLEEETIAELERWIDQGALRAPGAAAAPMLNNPPRRPQVAIYNGTTRLDGPAQIDVTIGTTLTFRHTVQDFETADDKIPFAAIILGAKDGRNVVLVPADMNSPQVGPTTYDPTGPMSQGDRLNYVRAWTIPSMLELYNDKTKMRGPATASNEMISVLAVYIDSPTQGIVALDVSPTRIHIP